MNRQMNVIKPLTSSELGELKKRYIELGHLNCNQNLEAIQRLLVTVDSLRERAENAEYNFKVEHEEKINIQRDLENFRQNVINEHRARKQESELDKRWGTI